MNVALDAPVHREPFSSKFLQCRVTASVWSEPMTDVAEIGAVRAIVDCFEDHMHDLLYHFIPHARNAEFAHLSVWLWYVLLPYQFEAELFGFHCLNDLPDVLQREAVKCFLVCSRRHVSRLRLDPFVSHNVHAFFVQNPIHISVYPLPLSIHFLYS